MNLLKPEPLFVAALRMSHFHIVPAGTVPQTWIIALTVSRHRSAHPLVAFETRGQAEAFLARFKARRARSSVAALTVGDYALRMVTTGAAIEEQLCIADAAIAKSLAQMTRLRWEAASRDERVFCGVPRSETS